MLQIAHWTLKLAHQEQLIFWLVFDAIVIERTKRFFAASHFRTGWGEDSLQCPLSFNGFLRILTTIVCPLWELCIPKKHLLWTVCTHVNTCNFLPILTSKNFPHKHTRFWPIFFFSTQTCDFNQKGGLVHFLYITQKKPAVCVWSKNADGWVTCSWFMPELLIESHYWATSEA